MANPNQPSDAAPSISAAELRRRLLASTPPPIAATASTPDPNEPIITTPGPASSVHGSTTDLLARLRMPGKSGSVPIPTPRPVAPPAAPPPTDPPPGRTPVNRRTPTGGSRGYGDANNALAGALNQLNEVSQGSGRMYEDPLTDFQRLRHENKELRSLLDEMKHLLQEASEGEQRFTAKEKEFQEAIGAKDSQIEELSTQLGAIEEQIAKGELAPPPPAPKTRTELEEWSDELEKEANKLTQDKKKLEDERRQFREDEEALEKQMREMEVSMARERALLARQETELKRLSAEIQHELEILQRGDAGLREQMAKFQRRAQEVMTTKPGGTGRR